MEKRYILYLYMPFISVNIPEYQSFLFTSSPSSVRDILLSLALTYSLSFNTFIISPKSSLSISIEFGLSKFILRSMVKEQVDLLEELFPNRFEITTNRDETEYIYTVEKLSKLSGKKLHGKRNHIARFKDNANWSYEDISDDNFKECLEMNDEWCKLYDCIDDPSLNHELCAVKEAFGNYNELGLVGGLLRREGKVIAYTIGSRINEDTFNIHIEKAFANIQGAYPMINQQFVQHNCQEYVYVNREEDLGDEGLRKAKMSYYPDVLLDKYTARLL